MEARNVRELTISSGRWLLLLVLTVVVSQGVASAWETIWSGLSSWLTPLAAGLLIAGLLLVLAVFLAVMLRRVSLAGSQPVLAGLYALKMLPYWLRELATRERVRSGKSNTRFVSLETFHAAAPRRAERYQVDYGVGWPDGPHRIVGRVTWLKATGELIAASDRGGDGGVEILAEIASESEVERRLKDWEYVRGGLGGGLGWIRRRACGWNVSLPPSAQLWLLEDGDPRRPWPPPPPPSLGRDEGAYLGVKG